MFGLLSSWSGHNDSLNEGSKSFTKKTAPLFDELLNYLQAVWHAKKCRVACKKGLNCAFKVKVTLRTDFFF